MKILERIGILILVVVLTSSGFAQEVERHAKILDLAGKVEAVLKPVKKWVPAKINMVLHQGDIIRTKANSWAVLELDGTEETDTIEIKENSQVMLSEIISNEEKKAKTTLLDLAIGKILIKAQKLRSPESKFEVKTPTSLIGVRGTVFAVEVETLE